MIRALICGSAALSLAASALPALAQTHDKSSGASANSALSADVAAPAHHMAVKHKAKTKAHKAHKAPAPKPAEPASPPAH